VTGADLWLVRMSELYLRHTITAIDESDFPASIRGTRRETIPILARHEVSEPGPLQAEFYRIKFPSPMVGFALRGGYQPGTEL
jgi:hypothetical protein